ncbi:Lrp/AsnC family transcriptional regulator [Kitasatospora sp. LaBMicrA B282]|uniref:Lrp/AsnC family transcriptional regulator n=1 Tax=Kitasatospora sp. LaBMicrA B282 TaxID=3420949 RepID=UPI003D0E0CC9
MDSDRYDALDRQIAHALQIDGRAPFSTIAQVLGVSDRTVARRCGRLFAAGALRVSGATDPVLLGEVPWFLRVRCAPDAAPRVAEALARRPDTRWISLTSGGTEIVCSVHARSEQETEALLLTKLPRTPRVEGITAHCVLHTFFGRRTALIDKHGPLTDDQVERLRPAGPHAGSGPVQLDAADRRLLAELAADGRAGFDRLAAVTGWSPSTVRRRLAELRGLGALYFEVEFDWRLLGFGTRTMLWLSVEPARLDAAGRALAAHPETAFAAATTGPTSLYASVLCADQAALYRYLTERVAALPGAGRVETAPVIRTVKRGSGGLWPQL